MEFRARRFKIGALTLTAMILAYSVLNWYYSDRQLDFQSLRLPESIKPGSWSHLLPSRRPPHDAAPAVGLATTATATVAPSIGTPSSPQSLGVAVSPNPNGTNETTDSISEEIIKPSTDGATFEASHRPTIAKITIMFGNDNPTYERALKTHEVHNRIHGYPVHVLRQQILYDVWTKPAYILSVLLKELTKPESERLKWLLWFDADTVLMNPYIPLDIFLPPDEFDQIHLLVTNDINGLNNGVFPIRVHPWSVALMSAVVAFTTFRPGVELIFRDQSALDEVLKEEPFRDHVLRLPQRWFNAYVSGALSETVQAHQVRRGDLLVHFAGIIDRESFMQKWLDTAEKHLPEWELDLVHSSYPGEIKEYWAERHAEAEAAKEQLRTATESAHQLLQLNEKQLDAFKDRLGEEESKAITGKVDVLRKAVNEGDHDVESIHKAIDELEEARTNLLRLVQQDKRDTIKAAYVAIYESENEVVKADGPALEAESHALEERMERLRKLLVEKPDDTDAVRRETDELRRATGIMAPKIHQQQQQHTTTTPEVGSATKTQPSANGEASTQPVDDPERPGAGENHPA